MAKIIPDDDRECQVRRGGDGNCHACFFRVQRPSPLSALDFLGFAAEQALQLAHLLLKVADAAGRDLGPLQ